MKDVIKYSFINIEIYGIMYTIVVVHTFNRR